MFTAKLLFPNLSLFFPSVGTSLSGFDALLPIFRLKDEGYHCGSVFHSVWLPLAGALVLLTFDVAWSASFLTGGPLHLLKDSNDVRGRPWLYPLSKTTYGFAVFPYDFRDYVSAPLSCDRSRFNPLYLGVCLPVRHGSALISPVCSAPSTFRLIRLASMEEGEELA